MREICINTVRMNIQSLHTPQTPQTLPTMFLLLLILPILVLTSLPAQAAEPAQAIAVLHPTEGNKTTGWVRFEQAGTKVKVTAEVSGLEPNSEHGIHIHEYGDCSSLDGKCAGGHYNPDGNDHALPSTARRHAGDLGNLKANAKGVAKYELTVDNISVDGSKNPIIGRGIIVHAKKDDGGQPTGNAGARLACGVIGYAMPMESK